MFCSHTKNTKTKCRHTNGKLVDTVKQMGLQVLQLITVIANLSVFSWRTLNFLLNELKESRPSIVRHIMLCHHSDQLNNSFLYCSSKKIERNHLVTATNCEYMVYIEDLPKHWVIVCLFWPTVSVIRRLVLYIRR